MKQGPAVLAAETGNSALARTQAEGQTVPSLALGKVTDMQSTLIAPGVRQTVLVVQSDRGRQQIHLLEVNPSAPEITLEVGFSDGKVVGLTPVTEQARAVSRPGHRVIAAIDGDAYSTSPPLGIPNGLVIHRGQLVTTPGGGAAFGITEDDKAIMGMPKVTVTMTVHSSTTAGLEDSEATARQTIIINKVNRPRSGNDIVLYTPMYAASTLTDDNGIEVVLGNVEGELLLNSSITAEVREIRSQKGSTPLSDGIMVLSGAGTGANRLKQLQVGDKVSITVNISEPWERVKEAIGGHPGSNTSILVQDGKLGPNLDQAVHPRTALGVRADGTLLLLTVDGRQPGYSEGVTTTELARLMLDLGAVHAINLDGGGSTTFVARQPGDAEPTVQNSPSDGYERAVGNSLLVISTAPEGPLAQLAVRPERVRLLAGSKFTFTVKGLDEWYNPVPISGPVEWEVSPGLGEISPEGVFVAAGSAASGVVSAVTGQVRGSALVEVVDKLSTIRPLNERMSVNPGETTVIRVTGYDSEGKPVEGDPTVYRWEVIGDIGRIDQTGRFTATDATGVSGAIQVSFGDVSVTIPVDIGKPPVLLEDFENGISHWTAGGARYTRVQIALASPPEPVRFGNHSLKLIYDFTGQKGTSGAYAYTKQNVVLEGYPEKIGMWVYGDGKGHWLRAQLRDANNAAIPIDFTDATNGVNWTGWRYVEAVIPKGKTPPLRLDLQVRYMETNDNKKDAGVLYVDHIRALYGDVDEDTEIPRIVSASPSPASKVLQTRPTIRVQVEDNPGGTGIDPQSVQMKLDGEPVTPTYESSSRTINYVPTEPLLDGVHEVWVGVKDRAGNPAEFRWVFQVSAGGPELLLVGPESVEAGASFVLNFDVKGAPALAAVAATLKYDPAVLEIVDADEESPGIQLRLNERFAKNETISYAVDPTQGRIDLQLTGLEGVAGSSEAETLASVAFRVAPGAAGAVEVSVESASLQLKGRSGPVTVYPAAYQARVTHGLLLTVDRATLGQPSTFTVKDKNGLPVEGAAIHLLEPVSKRRLLGLTNADGELTTTEFAVAAVTTRLQAVKEGAVSPIVEVKIAPLLGSRQPEHIVLTWKHDPSTSQTFTWRTSPEVTGTVLQIVPASRFDGTFPETDQDATGIRTVFGTSYPFLTSKGEMQIHEVEVTGLEPGTEYAYRVGDGTPAGWSKPARFTTAPAGAQPFTFLFVTDTQAIANASTSNGYGIWGEVLGKALREYPEARFVLIPGDLVDAGDQQEHWEYWFAAARDYLPFIPVVPALGNHELIGGGEAAFLAQFQLPENGPPGQVEKVYSLGYGNLHLAVLNTEGDLASQVEWLRQDMAKSDKMWKVVALHRPPYHSRDISDSKYVQDALAPVFDELGIDLVLAGHDHSYMRSWPLYRGRIVGDGEGTVYIVGGTAGSKFYSVGNHEWMRVTLKESVQVYTAITIDGNKLSVTAITRDGRVIDSFTMAKGAEE
ncbi:MAG: phosphodiester glycosidase family protein [Limnochordales bacterium]|nr:phosphodiester glycosidase family protein [Limnochordales bacterium]